MTILFGGNIVQNFSKSDQENFQNEFYETLFLHTFAKYECQFFHFMDLTGLNS